MIDCYIFETSSSLLTQEFIDIFNIKTKNETIILSNKTLKIILNGRKSRDIFYILYKNNKIKFYGIENINDFIVMNLLKLSIEKDEIIFTEEQIKDKYLLNEMFTNDLIIDILYNGSYKFLGFIIEKFNNIMLDKLFIIFLVNYTISKYYNRYSCVKIFELIINEFIKRNILIDKIPETLEYFKYVESFNLNFSDGFSINYLKYLDSFNVDLKDKIFYYIIDDLNISEISEILKLYKNFINIKFCFTNKIYDIKLLSFFEECMKHVSFTILDDMINNSDNFYKNLVTTHNKLLIFLLKYKPFMNNLLIYKKHIIAENITGYYIEYDGKLDYDLIVLKLIIQKSIKYNIQINEIIDKIKYFECEKLLKLIREYCNTFNCNYNITKYINDCEINIIKNIIKNDDLTQINLDEIEHDYYKNKIIKKLEQQSNRFSKTKSARN